MLRITTTAAFAAILAASGAVALAQTPANPAGPKTAAPSDTATSASVTSNRVMPGQIRLSDMNGATVYDTQNKDIGDVKDVILDRDGRVAAVVLNVGATLGMGGKLVAVPMREITITDKNNKPRFTVGKTESQLKSAPAFALNTETAKTGSSTAPATKPPATRRD